MVLEHTSEALTEYLGQNVPSLASFYSLFCGIALMFIFILLKSGFIN